MAKSSIFPSANAGMVTAHALAPSQIYVRLTDFCTTELIPISI